MDGMSNRTAQRQIEGSNRGGYDALGNPYNKNLEIRKDNISIDSSKLLGSGESGVVTEAVINGKTPVALKATKEGCNRVAVLGFLSEIKILTYLDKHPNIVSIVEAYTAEMAKGVVYIAIELCPMGSLLNYLRKGGNTVETSESYQNLIPISQMYQWCHEIACGMEFLSLKNVIHADLAARNVLLTGNKTAKITDFGLSRRLYDYSNYVKKQQEPLPWRWMAVESLKQMTFSSQSDVWSYGITLWEIFSFGDQPYSGVMWDFDFVQKLKDGLRLPRPENASPEIYEIMMNCWKLDTSERPTFSELRLVLGHYISSRNEVALC